MVQGRSHKEDKDSPVEAEEPWGGRAGAACLRG